MLISHHGLCLITRVIPTHQPRSFCSIIHGVNTPRSPHKHAAWPSGSGSNWSRAQLLLCSPRSNPAREEKPGETKPFRSVHMPFLFWLEVAEKVKYVKVEWDTDASLVQKIAFFNLNQGSLLLTLQTHGSVYIYMFLHIESDLVSTQTPSGWGGIVGKLIMK